MLDLNAIFNPDDAVAPRLVAAPPSDDAALPQAPPVAGEPAKPQPTAGGDAANGTLADDPFAAWVLRPDAAGRMGWEPPDLPEWARWWARSTFDDLPDPVGPGSRHEHEPRPCCCCGGKVFWRSIHGVLVCGFCHPPPVPTLAAKWLLLVATEDGPAWEQIKGG